jgi:hypothetical protein
MHAQMHAIEKRTFSLRVEYLNKTERLFGIRAFLSFGIKTLCKTWIRSKYKELAAVRILIFFADSVRNGMVTNYSAGIIIKYDN